MEKQSYQEKKELRQQERRITKLERLPRPLIQNAPPIDGERGDGPLIPGAPRREPVRDAGGNLPTFVEDDEPETFAE